MKNMKNKHICLENDPDLTFERSVLITKSVILDSKGVKRCVNYKILKGFSWKL